MIAALGIDIVEIARIRRMLERHGERALHRLFTPGEASYAASRTDPAMHLAARFAAKEAAFKALAGTPEARAIGWREVEVGRELDGRPVLRFHGAAARRADALGITRSWLSLTHDHSTAAATVILERDA